MTDDEVTDALVRAARTQGGTITAEGVGAAVAAPYQQIVTYLNHDPRFALWYEGGTYYYTLKDDPKKQGEHE